MISKKFLIIFISVISLVLLILLGLFYMSRNIREIPNSVDQVPVEESKFARELFERNGINIGGYRIIEVGNQLGLIKGPFVRLQPLYRGLPIFEHGVLYLFNEDGTFKAITGERDPGSLPSDLSIMPRLNAREAAKIAQKAGLISISLTAELGIYRKVDTQDYILAWKIKPDDNELPYAYIDAASGDILVFQKLEPVYN